MPGVKRVDSESVLHVYITIGHISEAARMAIYEAERRLIEAHREILFNFRLVKEPPKET